MRIHCLSAGYSSHRRSSTPSNSLHIPHLGTQTTSSRKRSLATKSALTNNQNQESIDIYFDENKRKTYLHSVIDQYFTSGTIKSSSEFTAAPYFRRKPLTSENKHRQKLLGKQIGTSRIVVMAQTVDPDEMHSPLPVISEGEPKRPVSQQYRGKRQIRQLLNLANEESKFGSNRQSQDSKWNSQLGDGSSLGVQTLEVKVSKCRMKVFGTCDDTGLIRQKLVSEKGGMKVLWQMGSNNRTLQYRPYSTLRRLCYSSVQQSNGVEPILLIYPKPYYHQLFANNCEELTDIVVQLCKGVNRGKGLISNNQICLERVARIDQKEIYAVDWSKAGYYEQVEIQGRKFPTIYDPICKENDNWVVSPEYLAPQMLRAVKSGYFGHLWEQPGGIGACDIWSIGLLIAELVTLVPLGLPNYCKIKGTQQRRKGLMGCRVKTVQNLLAKQRNLRRMLLQWVNKKVVSGRIALNSKLQTLLPKMLEQSPQQRISAEAVLAFLR